MMLAAICHHASFAFSARVGGAAVFENVGLIAKHGDERVAKTLQNLCSYLSDLHVNIFLDARNAKSLPNFQLTSADRETLAKSCDLVIIIGGDGTFLSAARSLGPHDARLLGINLGRLGFLTDISPADMNQHLGEIFAGNFTVEKRFLLRATIMRGGERVIAEDALNDVVVHKWNIARLIEFETYVDARLVNSQRSDGLIVSTPTGSTAYALSGGGPVLCPTLEAVVLVPICPHTLSSRPIVVDAGSRIEIVMGKGAPAEAQLTCDGQTTLELEPGDRICIRKRDGYLNLIHPASYDYYATLRTKLHWGKEL